MPANARAANSGAAPSATNTSTNVDWLSAARATATTVAGVVTGADSPTPAAGAVPGACTIRTASPFFNGTDGNIPFPNANPTTVKPLPGTNASVTDDRVTKPPAAISTAARFPTSVSASRARTAGTAGSTPSRTTTKSSAVIVAPRVTVSRTATTSTRSVADVNSHTAATAPSNTLPADPSNNPFRRRTRTGTAAAAAGTGADTVGRISAAVTPRPVAITPTPSTHQP